MMFRKKLYIIMFVCACTYVLAHAEEKTEMMPFGNFDSWATRYIKESFILGGETKAHYSIGPRETIQGPTPLPKRGNSPWGTSNAYAKVLGVETVTVPVTPEKRGNGYCCRMETKLHQIGAIGINFNAVATGSVFTGVAADPMTSEFTTDPRAAINMGVPFRKRPVALMLDYKAKILNGEVTYANGTTVSKRPNEHDAAQIILLLQHRWEENGRIFAYRVGTATERITKSTQNWVNNHRLDVRYGDITSQPNYKPWEALSRKTHKARNKSGRMVFVEEKGFRADVEPTHIIIMISSGCLPPFTGCVGNTLWVDNVRLVY